MSRQRMNFNRGSADKGLRRYMSLSKKPKRKSNGFVSNGEVKITKPADPEKLAAYRKTPEARRGERRFN